MFFPANYCYAGQEDHRGGRPGASLSGRGTASISFVHVHMLLHDKRWHETVQGGFRAFGRPSVRRSLGAKAHERAASER